MTLCKLFLLTYLLVQFSESSFRRSAIDWFEATGPNDLCKLPEGLVGINRKQSGGRRALIDICERVGVFLILTKWDTKI